MNKIARLSLVVCAALSLGLSFATVANALPGVKPKGATIQDLQQQTSSPEIAAAEQRVEQAKAQVDLANKQVNASRALLKAAQADLKAASSEVAALKMSAAAQGLVDQTGMTPAKAAPVAIAAKSEEAKEKANGTNTVPPTAPSVTAPNTVPAVAPSADEASKPAGTIEAPVEPIQLR